MAAMRLRKAFRYPEDSDGEREELDEQEQERVIQQLQRQNDTRNAQYSLIFTAIPLLSVVAFLPSVVSPTSYAERFYSLLSIVSLLATAYIMRHTPLHPDRKGKRPLSAGDEWLAWLARALVPTNGVLCLLLATMYFLKGASETHTQLALYLIPFALLVVILLVRKTMLSVDLSALKDLQYEYKGA